jgi:hypothetical protein
LNAKSMHILRFLGPQMSSKYTRQCHKIGKNFMNSSLFKINVSNLDQFDANLLRFKEINNKITRSGCVKLVSAILYKVIILHEKPTL